VGRLAVRVPELFPGWWIGQEAAEFGLCFQHPSELARRIVTQLFEALQALLELGGVRQGGVEALESAVSTPPPDSERHGADESDLCGPDEETEGNASEL
jgi:hypothetical protein